MRDPEVTVVVCTRDRVEHLSANLASVLVAVEASALPAELVVVDNGSSDATPAVLDSLAARHPVLRVLHEPRPSTSAARNAAVASARGRAVVFTDDDLSVVPGWVEAMAEPLLAGRAGAVAGRVELGPELRPATLTPYVRVRLAESCLLEGEDPPLVGANMAIAVEVARAHPFDTALGGGGLGAAEDTLLTYQLRRAGVTVARCREPAAVHHLDPERLDRPGLLGLVAAIGRSDAYIWHHWLHTRLAAPRLRSWRWRGTLALHRLRLRLHQRRDRPDDRPDDHELELAYQVALTAELAEQRHRPRRYAA